MGDENVPLVPDRRITDSERDAVMARLRAATVEGSLDLDELGSRIDEVFKARTASELAVVTHDLPEPTTPPTTTGGPPARRSIWRNLEFRIHAATWGLTNGFLTGIWALAGGGHFWPFYPAASWGVALGLHGMVTAAYEQRRAEKAASGDHDDEHTGKRAAREQRRAAQRAARQELLDASQAAAIDLQRKAARAVRKLGSPPASGAHGPASPTPPPVGPPPGRPGRPDPPDPGAHAPGSPSPVARVAALFVDVVGSTQLTTAMGDESWSAVRARYRSLVGRYLAEHGGNEANVAGDGILARFPSDSAAARCAIGIQRELAEQRTANGFAPRVRIAVHSGVAVADGPDLVGHVINLVCRICDEADPDEILVTETVAEQLDGRFELEDRGLRTLKGITRPRHLLAVAWR